MPILLVEDNQDVANSIISELHKKNYLVEHVNTVSDALAYIEHQKLDLVILDLMLPDASGFDLINRVRTKDNTIPILVISALTEVDYRIKGLNMGADDYLVKPFNPEELIARVFALLRRQSNTATNRLKFKTLELDLDEQIAYREGQPIELRRKEFQLLEYLIRNQGIVLSRFQLLDHAWGTDADIDSNKVDVHIRLLRKKIDIPFDEGYIRTIKGSGYVLR